MSTRKYGVLLHVPSIAIIALIFNVLYCICDYNIGTRSDKTLRSIKLESAIDISRNRRYISRKWLQLKLIFWRIPSRTIVSKCGLINQAISVYIHHSNLPRQLTIENVKISSRKAEIFVPCSPNHISTLSVKGNDVKAKRSRDNSLFRK